MNATLYSTYAVGDVTLLSYSTICNIGSWSYTLVLYMDDRLYFLTLLATGHGLFTHTHIHTHFNNRMFQLSLWVVLSGHWKQWKLKTETKTEKLKLVKTSY